MNIPFWDPRREYFKYQNEINNAIEGVLESGKLVLGYCEEIERFEESFAKFIDKKYCVMCGAGTQALYLAYRAIGIKYGDEVITTSHTFIATIDQIVANGGIPVLADIEGTSGLIDPVQIEKLITGKTKAIVPVHLEGKVCDMDAIMALAKKYQLAVIEDGAQAIGATGIGKGDAICFSFFPAKILGSVGNAGAICTDDEQLAKKLKMLRCNYNIGKNPDIGGAQYGTNMEPDGIQAAVLNIKMKYLPERLARRKEIAQKYDEAFRYQEFLTPLKQEGRVYQDYIILTKNPEKLANYLREKGIGSLGVSLIPNHNYPNLKLNFVLPQTDAYLKHQIRIPCNPDLSDEEVDYIIKIIKEYYAK